MLKRFKNISAAFALAAIMTLTPAAVTALSLSTAPVDLFAGSLRDEACAGLSTIDGSQGCAAQDGESGVRNVVASVIRILSYVVGIFAVIFIVVAGFKYITSGGDSNKLSSAKSTLIYALIGIAIVALAQFLVNFVFTAASGGQIGPPPTD